MDYLIDIGQKLEKIRKLKGFSQQYIAGKLNISQNSYSKIERGETEVTLKKFHEICKVLEIDSKMLETFDPLQEFKQLTQTEDIPTWAYKIFNSLDRITKLCEELLSEKDVRIGQLKEIANLLKKDK